VSEGEREGGREGRKEGRKEGREGGREGGRKGIEERKGKEKLSTVISPKTHSISSDLRKSIKI
jgi:flagellar biosynthesis/type III secretory pathway protein FliH